jgi:hypothetical protein
MVRLMLRGDHKSGDAVMLADTRVGTVVNPMGLTTVPNRFW